MRALKGLACRLACMPACERRSRRLLAAAQSFSHTLLVHAILQYMFSFPAFAGATYYARYDGGMETAVREAGGVSSLVIGRALAPDMMLSLVRTGTTMRLVFCN